jgi:DNA-binding GntR family transcriptional regulator
VLPAVGLEHRNQGRSTKGRMKAQAKQIGPVPRPKTIATQIAERIILAIANGEQQPGERLTEGNLAEAMNVSRVPAREALLYLQSIGIVIPLKRRGLRIVDFSPGQALEVREVRMGLEGVAVKMAMRVVRKYPERMARLDEILEIMQERFEIGDAISLAQCDVEFHREIMRLSGNSLLEKFWEGLAPHLIILFCRDWHASKGKIGEVKLHQRLRKLIAEGDPGEVEEVLADHLAPPSLT